MGRTLRLHLPLLLLQALVVYSGIITPMGGDSNEAGAKTDLMEGDSSELTELQQFLRDIKLMNLTDVSPQHHDAEFQNLKVSTTTSNRNKKKSKKNKTPVISNKTGAKKKTGWWSSGQKRKKANQGSFFSLSPLWNFFWKNSKQPECPCKQAPCPKATSKTKTTRHTLGVGLKSKPKKANYNYSLNKMGYSVIRSANVVITNKDVGKLGDRGLGTDTSPCVRTYTDQLVDVGGFFYNIVWGKPMYDAGHILAHELGGPGKEPINIFPQAEGINRGQYKMFELDIRDCLLTGGAKQAKLSWKFEYNSNSRTMPSSITYNAIMVGGKSMSKKAGKHIVNCNGKLRKTFTN